MRSRRHGVVAVAALGLVVAACAAPGAGDPQTGDATVRVVDEGDPANLVLYVSNQSFEHDVVGIVVAIDGVVVVDQDFDVEGQHNWIEFWIELPPGDHTLTATSSTEAEGEQAFILPAGEQRWLVVDYWYYPDKGDGGDVTEPSFTFHVSEEPVAFS